MSWTEIVAVPYKGEVESIGDCPNSHIGGFFVWEILALEWDMPRTETWKEIDNQDRPFALRCLLGTTFDRIILPRKHATEFRAWVEALVNTEGLVKWLVRLHTPPSFDIERGNKTIGDFFANLRKQAAVLESHANDERLLGFGWNQTSVNANPWYVEDATEEDSHTFTLPGDAAAPLAEWPLAAVLLCSPEANTVGTVLLSEYLSAGGAP